MYRLLLACSLLAACKISDAHFVGGGFPDGPRGDTPMATPLKKGYLVDGSAGILLVAKDPTTGALTAVTQLMTSAAAPYGSAVVSKTGTHLFLFTGDTAASSKVVTLAIAADGRTSDGPSTFLSMCPRPQRARLHPSGKYILVSCENGSLQELVVAADDTLTPGPITTAAQTTANVVFTISGDGTCVYAIDTTIAPARIVTFAFDPMTGALGPSQTYPQQVVPYEIATTLDGKHVYATGSGTPAMIAELDASPTCALTAKATISVPNQPTVVAPDPTGTYFHTAGPSPYAFSIATDGTLTALSASSVNYPVAPFNLVFDPQFPAMAYVTDGGSVIAHPSLSGVLQPGTATTGTGMNAVSFVMAP
jgi:hypothetical protein